MVWLIGCKGMLGTEVGRQLTESKVRWVGSDRDVDITDSEALATFAEAHDRAANRTGNAVARGTVSEKITWVVNCAAYTDVDGAEEHAENARRVNEDGARNIARAARTIGAKLVHVSTDYVFDGNAAAPYTEDDVKHPLNVYGAAKSAGEDAIQKEMTQYYILRSSWLYGFDGGNFVYTMTRLMNQSDQVQVVDDRHGSPTFAGNLASVILRIMATSDRAPTLFGKKSALPYGIYHYADLGETTWFGFAQKIYEYGHKYKRITQACAVHPLSPEEREERAARPAYSVLGTQKIQAALRLKIPAWEDSLERFMKSARFSIK